MLIITYFKYVLQQRHYVAGQYA